MDWECGGRDKVTCERLLERLKRWRTRLYCADDYAVYDVLLPVGQLYTGKDETHALNETTRVSGTGWRASAGARSWSRRPSTWWTSVSRSSPASPETTESAISYLCRAETLRRRLTTVAERLLYGSEGTNLSFEKLAPTILTATAQLGN